jgi:hypothetical protein
MLVRIGAAASQFAEKLTIRIRISLQRYRKRRKINPASAAARLEIEFFSKLSPSGS